MHLLQIEQVLKMPSWLLVIGLVLIIFLISLALITGREVTFWPPKIGPVVSRGKALDMSKNNIADAESLDGEKVRLYTEWRLGKNRTVYEEYLDILIINNIVTGTRKTISLNSTTEYIIRGYKTENNLRIEYYSVDNVGGGQIILQKIVQGWYTGCVSYMNCDSGLFKCYLNRWYDFNLKNQYLESFQQDIM
jgi:hypothetical protein